MNELKKCPFCGGKAILVKYNESVDGRCDELPYIKCTCGARVVMSYKELNDLKDKHGFIGGYISSNKSLWDGMHKMISEKWNKRGAHMSLCSAEELERYNEEKIQKLKDESERLGKITDELDVDKLVSKTLKNENRSYHVCPCELLSPKPIDPYIRGEYETKLFYIISDALHRVGIHGDDNTIETCRALGIKDCCDK